MEFKLVELGTASTDTRTVIVENANDGLSDHFG